MSEKNKTLADELITLIRSVANNNPAPTKCKITKIYDNGYADAETNIGTLEYIETIGNTPTLNKTGVIIYLDGDLNTPIIIC